MKDLIDEDKVEYIDDTNGNKDKNTTVKTIDTSLFDKKPFDNTRFPLWIELPRYDHKNFNSFSVSQYLEFKQCRRLFYMKYYKKFPIEILYPTDVHKEVEKTKVAPSTRGNIVHEFCEHYRGNMDVSKLLG